LSDEQVWAEVERRRSGSTAPPKTIKQAEIETLLAAEESLGEDAPTDADFFARRMPAREMAQLPKVERVVKLHRLREVVALVGFTRFEPATTDVDGDSTSPTTSRRSASCTAPRVMGAC